MISKKQFSRILFSVGHGILLFLLLFFINQTSYTSEVDETLFKPIEKFENLFSSGSTIPRNLVFINTAKNIQLVDLSKDSAKLRDSAKLAITNRQQLADFLGMLADSGNTQTYVLCDIFLDYPTLADSALQQQATKCKRLIFPAAWDNHQLKKPRFNLFYGIANTNTYTETLSRFQLTYGDTLPTIPLAMARTLQNAYRDKSFGGKFPLTTITTHYYLTPEDLDNSNDIQVHDLGHLLTLCKKNNSFFRTFLSNKLFVIGDLDNRSYATPIGNTCSPLVLLNVYLSLANGRGMMSIWWIIISLLFLSATSYILFYVKIKAPASKNKWLNLLLTSVVNKFVSFLGICYLLALISELFSTMISISVLLGYLTISSEVIKYYKENYKTNDPNHPVNPEP